MHGSFIHEATLLQVDVFFRIVFHLSLSIHSPNLTWNLKNDGFQISGISSPIPVCHFQVNHVKLWEGSETSIRYILRGVHVLLCVFNELA